MKRMLFIVNAHSGKGVIKNSLTDIVRIFNERDYDVSLYVTGGHGDAVERAMKACSEGFEIIACSGGDGTLNEVINGVMQCEERPRIGYIPCGTQNDFATCLRIPKLREDAALNIMEGTPVNLDVGRYNDKYFCYVAAFGAYTEVSYETPQIAKNMFGKVAYFLECLKRTFNIKSYRMTFEYDGQTITDEIILGLISNSTSVGSFKIPGTVSLTDGLFEVILIKAPKNPIELQSTITAFIKQDLNSEYVYYFKTSKLVITAETEVPWTLDGEAGGACSNTVISNERLAITLLLPDEASINRIME